MNNQAVINPSLSITEESKEQTLSQKVGGICVAIAILALIAAMSGAGKEYPTLFLTLIMGCLIYRADGADDSLRQVFSCLYTITQ